MKIGKLLRISNSSAVNIERFSEDRISILFQSGEEANDFVVDKVKLLNENWSAFIPYSALLFSGIIRDIPVEFNNEEILEGIVDEPLKNQIFEISRIKKRVVEREKEIQSQDNNSIKFVDSDSIKITFKNKILNSININFCYRKIFKFIPQVRRCFNCQKFGHTNINCKSNPKCVNCGSNHDNVSLCTKDSCCANCESNHKASDKNCPLYKFFREVNKVRTLSNIKYSEATDIVKHRYIFNQKVKNNAIENIHSLKLLKP